MTKRMLLIADTDTIWTMKMLKYLLLPQGYEVVLFPIWGNKGKYDDFYRESGVTIYEDRHNLGLKTAKRKRHLRTGAYLSSAMSANVKAMIQK